MRYRVRGFELIALVAAVVLGAAVTGPSLRAADSVINAPPQAKDWASLAKLPDWSGVWTPNMTDQEARIKSDPVPWRPEAAAQVAKLDCGGKGRRTQRGCSSIACRNPCRAGC